MPGIDELLANNRRFVERFPVGHLDARPSWRPLERLRTSPFLAHHDRVRGFVYDVDTGTLSEIT